MDALALKGSETALVLIDLQRSVTSMETKPYPASKVIENAAKLINFAHSNGIKVFPVRVIRDAETSLRVAADNSSPFRLSSQIQGDPFAFDPSLPLRPDDQVITKRQWGAFYGTDLELSLRRRGINTIILAGIATLYGVESTARFAYEMGFNQIFAEDAMSDISEETHSISVEYVLKRIGRVRK